jgi:hypothetical protein
MFKPRKFGKVPNVIRPGSTMEGQPRDARVGPDAPVRVAEQSSAASAEDLAFNSHRRLRLNTIALLALTWLGSIPLLRGQSPDLPPGPAQAKVRTACLECHDASIIVQQRLSRAAWTKEVDKMIKWGALVEAADRDSFIDYLSTNFPSDKTPEEMPRTAPTKRR